MPCARTARNLTHLPGGGGLHDSWTAPSGRWWRANTAPASSTAPPTPPAKAGIVTFKPYVYFAALLSFRQEAELDGH